MSSYNDFKDQTAEFIHSQELGMADNLKSNFDLFIQEIYRKSSSLEWVPNQLVNDDWSDIDFRKEQSGSIQITTPTTSVRHHCSSCFTEYNNFIDYENVLEVNDVLDFRNDQDHDNATEYSMTTKFNSPQYSSSGWTPPIDQIFSDDQSDEEVSNNFSFEFYKDSSWIESTNDGSNDISNEDLTKMIAVAQECDVSFETEKEDQQKFKKEPTGESLEGSKVKRQTKNKGIELKNNHLRPESISKLVQGSPKNTKTEALPVTKVKKTRTKIKSRNQSKTNLTTTTSNLESLNSKLSPICHNSKPGRKPKILPSLSYQYKLKRLSRHTLDPQFSKYISIDISNTDCMSVVINIKDESILNVHPIDQIQLINTAVRGKVVKEKSFKSSLPHVPIYEERMIYSRDMSPIANAISNIRYFLNNKFGPYAPYVPQWTRYEINDDGTLIKKSRAGLCSYCKETRFFDYGASGFLSHLSTEHGIYSSGYLVPEGVNYGLYMIEGKLDRAHKGSESIIDQNLDNCFRGIQCPQCHHVIKVGCQKGKKELLAYLRHWKVKHKPNETHLITNQIIPLQKRTRRLDGTPVEHI